MKLQWRRLLLGVILAAIHSTWYSAAAQLGQSASTDRNLSQVFVLVSSKDGSNAELEQSTLGVAVDGQRAQINAVHSAKNDRMVFAVLLDISKSSMSDSASMKKAAMRFIEGLSANGNEGYLIFFDQTVSSPVAGSVRPESARRALGEVTFGGGTALYDAILQTCAHELSRSANPDVPRRIILLISDGEDNQSHIRRTDAEAAAETEGVSVFSLVPRSVLSGPEGQEFVKNISKSTGGLAVSGGNLTDGVTRLVASIEKQWLLSLMPAQNADQKLHALHIKTAQKDINISAPAFIFFK